MQNGLGWFDNIQQIIILSGMIFVLLIVTSLINKKQKVFKSDSFLNMKTVVMRCHALYGQTRFNGGFENRKSKPPFPF